MKPFVSEAHHTDGTVGGWSLPGLREHFPRFQMLWGMVWTTGRLSSTLLSWTLLLRLPHPLVGALGFSGSPPTLAIRARFRVVRGDHRRPSKNYEHWVYISLSTYERATVHPLNTHVDDLPKIREEIVIRPVRHRVSR
jgi:hypothetical protein